MINDYSVGKYILKALIISLVLSILLLLISSLVLTLTPLSEGYISIINVVVMIISISIASIYLANRLDSKGLLYGSLLGVIYFAVLTIINITFLNNLEFNIFYFARLFITIVIGGIGGSIGINLK